ncbi:hypothetical protein ACI4CD_28735, partial [Klebsiella pneumoniae]|uniref:hypothetical protein n=1 Tax=Klebsiella pneumoniae TaxID=573 RepID=UPI0038522E0C
FTLISAWIADIFFISTNKTLISIGVVSLFAFYVLLGIIFYRMNKLRLAKCQEAFLGLVVYLLLNFQLFKFIDSELKELRIPVIIFACGVG